MTMDILYREVLYRGTISYIGAKLVVPVRNRK